MSLFLALTTLQCVAELSREQVNTLKKSCGYLFSKQGSATAFVISDDLLTTCAHVVELSAEVEVAFSNEQGTWKTYKATCIARNQETDVAILKIADAKLSALARGSDQVFETSAIIALGFPFGEKLATAKDEFPDISLSLGRITSIRKTTGKVTAIQIDSELHPGFSGGPVVDNKGIVIGIISSGLPGTNLNTAIPIEALENLLRQPVINVTSPNIDLSKGGEFTAEVKFHTKPATPPLVKLELPGNKPLILTPSNDRLTYQIDIPVISKEQQLTLEIVYEDGLIKGTVTDRDIRIGNKSGKLSQLAVIEFGEVHQVTGNNGAKISGEVTGLSKLTINTSGNQIQPQLDKAKEIRISSTADAGTPYRLVVMTGDQVAGEASGVISKGGPEFAPLNHQSSERQSVSIVQVPNGKQEIKLPGIASNIAVGDFGKVLVISMEEISKIGVFDNQTLKFRGFIPMASTPAIVTANADSTFVYYPGIDTLISYRLKDLARQKSKKAPFETNIIKMAGGYASRRPVVALVTQVGGVRTSEFGKFNPVTLDGKLLKWEEPKKRHPFMSGDKNHLRISADGRIVTNTKPGTSPSGYSLIVINDLATAYYDHKDLGVISPSWDGSFIYTNNSTFRRPLNKIAEFKTPAFNLCRLIPAYHQNFYMSVMFTTIGRPREEDRKYPCIIHMAGSTAPIFEIEDTFEEMKFDSADRYDRDLLALDQRFYLNPQLGTLVTMPKGNDRLFIRSCDIMSALEKGGLPLLFLSNTPTGAKKGTLYRFKLDAPAAKKGGIRFSLESGPTGMTLSTAGTISWSVPKSQRETEFIIVKISSDSGEEKLYTLAIPIEG